MFGVYVLEVIEAFADKVQKLIVRDLEVMRLDDEGIDFIGKHFESHLFFERRIVLGDGTAFAGSGFNHTLIFEFAIRMSWIRSSSRFWDCSVPKA